VVARPLARDPPWRRRPSSAGAQGWTGLDATAARGDPLAPAWWAYAAAVDSDDLRLVAAAWSLCETLGAPLAPTVATVAEVVRRRRAVRHRITAALAGPQATMRVLAALPLSGPFVAMVVGVPPSELYAGAAGLFSLVVGVVLLLVGRAWAARMVRAVALEQPARAVRPDRGRARAHS
jgi:tight adherence protein B